MSITALMTTITIGIQIPLQQVNAKACNVFFNSEDEITKTTGSASSGDKSCISLPQSVNLHKHFQNN